MGSSSAGSDSEQDVAWSHQRERAPSSSCSPKDTRRMARKHPPSKEQSGASSRRSTSASFDYDWSKYTLSREPQLINPTTRSVQHSTNTVTKPVSSSQAGIGLNSEQPNSEHLLAQRSEIDSVQSSGAGGVFVAGPLTASPEHTDLSAHASPEHLSFSAPRVKGRRFSEPAKFGPGRAPERRSTQAGWNESSSESSHAVLMRLVQSAQVDEAMGATIYALMKEILLAPLTEHQLQKHKSIEIIIELGDDVRIIEAGGGQHAPQHRLVYLQTSFSKDGPTLLLLRASDLQIAAGRDCDTLLHLVALHGNAEALGSLLRNFYSQSKAEQCLSASADSQFMYTLELRNKDGRTPLHYACGKGHVEVVLMLLFNGADRYARDANGAVPFHFAARCGNIDIFDLLLGKKETDQAEEAQLNTKTSRTGMTALHYAAWNGHSDAVEWLLSEGAIADATDNIEGNTPLHWAASRKDCPAKVIGSLIVGGGADAQIQNNDGYWPIGLADKGGHHELARAIVSAIRRSTAIRMGVHKSIKTALLTDQQSSNGATLFHFFAAYGTEQDLEWFLSLLRERIHNESIGTAEPWHENRLLNMRDRNGGTVAHWATRLANKDALRVLAKHNVELNAGMEASQPHRTPLAAAILMGDMEFANELVKCKPMTKEWLSDNCKKWLEDYYSQRRKNDSNFERAFVALQDGYVRQSRLNNMKSKASKKSLFLDLPPIYLALFADREDIAIFIRQHCTAGVEDAVNARGGMGWTALHWATFLEHRKIVSTLCRSPHFAPFLAANAEDVRGRTALQYAKHMELGDIENELMQRDDVKAYVDRMYNDRQLYVDATNAILVGAALIASVTFAGWLQPPLSYTPYYDLPQLPYPSPRDSFQAYAAIQQSVGVRCFWVFNSLSFTMAICTMVAGLIGVAPTRGVFIAFAVRHLRRCLVIASVFLGISIVFVFAAFAAAGFAVLPPLFEYQANMMATIIVGGVPCLGLLGWFAGRLWSFRSRGLRKLFANIVQDDDGFEPSTKELETLDPPWYQNYTDNERSNNYMIGPRYLNRPWDDGLDPPPH